jgi:hypothetical protein
LTPLRQGIELRQDAQARRAHGIAQGRLGSPLRVAADCRLIVGVRLGDQLRVGTEFGGDNSQEGGATLVVETQVGFRQTAGALPCRDFAADAAGAFMQQITNAYQLFALQAARSAPSASSVRTRRSPRTTIPSAIAFSSVSRPATLRLSCAGDSRRRQK